MTIDVAPDGSRTIRLEGGVVGRLRLDPGSESWKYVWCVHSGEFHPGPTALENASPEHAEVWATEEIATLLAMRSQAMDRELD